MELEKDDKVASEWGLDHYFYTVIAVLYGCISFIEGPFSVNIG